MMQAAPKDVGAIKDYHVHVYYDPSTKERAALLRQWVEERFAGQMRMGSWRSLTFEGDMSIYLGKREVRLMQLGAGHTSGDIVAWVPDAQVMFSGDLIEYHSACYCGDAHLREWPATLNEIRAFNPKAIAPGRGDALKGIATGRDAIAMTRDFVTSLYGAAETAVAKARNLKETMAATREVMDPKFSSFAIYEHCLPFNVSRAFDEASGIDDPVIWTAERDLEMWASLQGG